MPGKHNNSTLSSKIIILIGLSLVSMQIKAQRELEILRGIQYSDAPNSLYHYLAKQAFVYLDKRSETIAQLRSLPQWQQRRQWVRETLNEVIGGFPEKKPLQAKVVKIVNKDGYRIENIIYESQPGYHVTASLFIPAEIKNIPAPAIIYCSGHSNTGYRAYQNVLLNLVKKGFIVFAFDPIGQGERLQYYNDSTKKSSFRWPAWEHSFVGAQLFITGNAVAQNFIWDGIRAVDYLLTRSEVDPKRIGITGRSGGGTQSAYIAAFDERIVAVAPENYITNYTRLIQAIGTQDAEQNFMYGIEKGLDMADLLEVRAPKPALMITTTQDMFPIQGAMETAAEVNKVYNVFGKPDNFRMVTDDAPHASTKKNREALYAFFQKTLNNPGDSTDQELKGLAAEDMQVTTTGQVSTSLNSESAYSLNYKNAQQKMRVLEEKRKNFSKNISGILISAKKLSGYIEPQSVPAPLFMGRFQKQGYAIEKYIVKGEGDYVIPYLLYRPAAANGKALIYLNPSGKLADTAVGGEMQWFVKNGMTVLAPDIVGMGEMGPGVFKGDSYIDSISYNIWFTSILINRSIVGIQAADVVRLTQLLKKDNSIKEIYGLAKKQCSPILLHAAAFTDNIIGIALIEPYSSYRMIAMTPNYNKSFLQSTVAGSLGNYDLPDLAASLAPRKLMIVGITDGSGSNHNTADIENDIRVIRNVYGSKSPSKLQIVVKDQFEKLMGDYKRWIGNE